MKLINLKQKSKEWIDWRRDKVMASDSPIIMGVSPYKNTVKLLDEKIKGYETPSNQWMQRGLDLEPKALAEFERMTGHFMFPCVGIHENEWMGASFDGMTIEGDAIVEIKCPGKVDHAIALDGKIPKKYIYQIQHQMYVAGLDRCFYFSFDGEEGKVLEVQRDDVLIDKMLEKLFHFWQILKAKI